jgi:hypothetical protein
MTIIICYDKYSHPMTEIIICLAGVSRLWRYSHGFGRILKRYGRSLTLNGISHETGRIIAFFIKYRGC